MGKVTVLTIKKWASKGLPSDHYDISSDYILMLAQKVNPNYTKTDALNKEAIDFIKQALCLKG